MRSRTDLIGGLGLRERAKIVWWCGPRAQVGAWNISGFLIASTWDGAF